MKKSACESLVFQILAYGRSVWDPHCVGQNEELEKVRSREARFETKHYSYETRCMTGVVGELKLEPFRKEGSKVYSKMYCFIKLLYKRIRCYGNPTIYGISDTAARTTPVNLVSFLRL